MSFVYFSDAILSLNPDANFCVSKDDDKDNWSVEWFENTTPISREDIIAERQRLQDIEDAK